MIGSKTCWLCALLLVSFPRMAATQQGTETVLVFISSAHSRANADANFARCVRELKSALRAKSDSSGTGFAAVGVAIDWEPTVGWAYLVGGVAESGDTVDLGPWDEVHVGRNWRNAVVVQYVFRSTREGMVQEGLPLAVVPQLILLRRTVVQRSDGLDFGDDEVVVRLMGGDAMCDWLEAHVSGGQR